MGGAQSLLLQDNQSVEYQSGASRLMKSIFMAICVAPLLLLGMCWLLGYNEQRAVCDQRAISAGSDAVQSVGCKDPLIGSGSLVMFSCDIVPASLPRLSLPGADFSSVQHRGTGVKADSQMYQCIEHDNSRTEKTQGGGTRTIHTYTYSREWKSTYVNSGSFSAVGSQNWRVNCGRDNPPWDSTVPQGVSFAPDMKVGNFTTTMTSHVPLDTPITNIPRPSGAWQRYGEGSFYRSYGGSPSSPRIGDLRVTFMSNNPNQLGVTVLGNNNAGSIENWVAPSSWLCSGFSLADLRMGSWSKDQLFSQLASEANALTWVLRFVGFAFMWLAFCLCFGPLEVAADCIPCVGPCLGDSIAAITCCISCLPASACCLGVAGVVWVVMRPLVGIPCIIACILIFGGFGSYIAKKRAEKRGGQVLLPGYGATGAPQMPMTTAMPVQAQGGRQMQVRVPEGYGAGQMVQFTTPDGNQMQAEVPKGVGPGGVFAVNY
mmetsp:Transcript_20723/g.39458  ORF Transcript_20723/g.39458 Transcript_20723/m.39458 type:complete len:487 (+) Transcript_20723:72-1532(+)